MATQNNALTGVIVNTNDPILANEDRLIGELLDRFDGVSQESFSALEDHIWESKVLEGIPNIHYMLRDYIAYLRWYRVKHKKSGEVTVDTLYVMWSESMQAVKIGRTCNDPNKRIASLKTGCPDIELVKTFPGVGKFEAHLHKKFSEFCVGGEWFSVTPEIAIKAIEEVVAA